MSNLIDVLNSAGLRTGGILPRSEIHQLGKHHRAVHIYLLNWKNEILLRRRSLEADHFPGFFSISVLGHLNAGEYSSDTVRRETSEELGIEVSCLRFDFLFSFFQEAILSETYIDRQFNDVYLTRLDIDLDLIRFDPSEVSEVQFIPFESFLELARSQPEYTAIYGNECLDLIYFLNAKNSMVQR